MASELRVQDSPTLLYNRLTSFLSRLANTPCTCHNQIQRMLKRTIRARQLSFHSSVMLSCKRDKDKRNYTQLLSGACYDSIEIGDDFVNDVIASNINQTRVLTECYVEKCDS